MINEDQLKLARKVIDIVGPRAVCDAVESFNNMKCDLVCDSDFCRDSLTQWIAKKLGEDDDRK